MATACAWSVALAGLESRIVEVEADIGAVPFPRCHRDQAFLPNPWAARPHSTRINPRGSRHGSGDETR